MNIYLYKFSVKIERGAGWLHLWSKVKMLETQSLLQVVYRSVDRYHPAGPGGNGRQRSRLLHHQVSVVVVYNADGFFFGVFNV